MSDDSKRLRLSLLTGLVAAVLVVAVGMVFAFGQHGKYQAETSLIVLPANTLDNTAKANYLETLSQGQITATLAEVAQSGRFESEAETAMALSAVEVATITVTVTVAPSTSVLLITAQASSKEVAEGVADRTAALAAAYLKSVLKPYTATQVRSAAGTAYGAGTSTTTLVAGVLAAALAVAVAVQQATSQVLQSRRRTRSVPPTGAQSEADISTASAVTADPARPDVASPPTATRPLVAVATAPGTTVEADAPTPMASVPTAVEPSPVATSRDDAANGSEQWSTVHGLGSGWTGRRSPIGVSVYTTNTANGSAEKSKDDAASKPEEDDPLSAEESGATNDRVPLS